MQSRYYDPAIGRFINADDASLLGADGSLLGYNLFAYCQNNPVNLSDDGGNIPSWATKLIVGTAVIAAAAALTVVTAGTGTALACFAVGALKGAAVGAAMGAATGAASGAVSHRISTGSWEGVGEAALNEAADGYMGGAISGFVAGGLTSNACFVAGTAVLAASGSIPIENIKAGDYVLAWDEQTGDVALKQVVETYVNESSELIHVFVNGEEIVTTPSHPFYSPVKGWTEAVHLRAGDILVLVNGEYVVVEKVQHEILEAPVTVYNFQVDDYHTYYVSDTGVLVHNVCQQIGGGHGSPTQTNRINAKIKELASSGKYSKIYGNRSLHTAGLVGNQRPNIIAIGKNGFVEVWEFASKSQATGTSGYVALKAKIAVMQSANGGAHFYDIIPW